MTFAARLSRLPRPVDRDRAEDIESRLGGLDRTLVELVAGTAGASPFLHELAVREADWLMDTLAGDPETAREGVLAETRDAPDETLDHALRRAKGRIALLTALADLGGVWSLEEVTKTLTDFADLATSRALTAAVAAEVRRGKLPGQGPDDVATGGGLVAIAMGKMGAGELNYSSDIDLICLFDETRFDPADYADARASFVRAVRRMTKTLSERTADGYVFRTDLRLRPDASVTPVALSMEAAERYYESFGRTWERAAYIKARAAAGDIAAGERFLKTLTPFVWRRHLDFAAIQDAHDMRLRIRDHKGLTRPVSHLGHDVKLGQGGIREIEFFTQTRQIIAGGRDPELRSPRTVEGLALLAKKGWIGEGDARQLTEDYRALRELEHRLQMVADQQTQTLPATEEDFARIAALSGVEAAEYSREIEERFHRVSCLTEPFFVPGAPKESAAEDQPELSENSESIVQRWKSYPALRSKRAVEIFDRMRPALIRRLCEARSVDEAVLHFDGFLSGLPAGVQVFSLFEANPQLLDLVVDIVDTAPALGQYLSRNSGVFDAVIGGGFFSDWPGCAALTADLTRELDSQPDYEARLDRARLWQKEWQFRIGVHHLRGLISAAEAGRDYADLAEATLSALWPVVVANFAEKHGQPPGGGATVLGMGSLGAGRLNAGSDLDLIVIYDGQGVEASEGRRPLATRAYYARLTQALVTAVSAPTAEGRLYEVDMRLRPSGRQGPVATGFESFREYQTNEAWTWEHLALTRARRVAGDAALGDRVEAFRRELLARDRDRESTLKDVRDMRRRLAEARPASHALDVKAGAGRLQDIELFAEAGTLLAGRPVRRINAQIAAAAPALGLAAEDAAILDEIYETLWQVQAAARLMSSGPLRAEDAGASAADFLVRQSGQGSLEALMTTLDDMAGEAAALIDKGLGESDLPD
ncbi:bifunctional [glutamine synthetase] adenylyltransferase/[glutamine synthetase]-adenylyl-L-tyrosine phosphorylase [Alphaproteobacteria bacterium GH1-50]|uniref:Bifunctional [glutamine synthetase] adenylyltransferase/[glutamine synthetase]-adenylyl-L-tyrosine phosphorylase n=1 Tax=Kangsaoukella pontilimi TaxID=2691042 RepID=A0A7C9MBP8_9RHOB|nr:bifunctional [glutamine synthetase] adenylyltransferase/[glutamine synthetase]-adenylyl-L-tyrosine phosphorylase [Kangsaoukella pontilimi]MXQ06971.1 bifunctional [glutamine synthetase] adenylyltransferase/[glutamine synthetase]-adenylyl-L-tyrosine phosphorylase [Kangsaoukella pontilimi]